MIPSECQRTIIRWLQDVIRRSSHRRVAFLRQSSTFLFPLYCLREKKSHDTIWKDALMMALWRTKWTHELNMKMNLRKVVWKFCGMPKILSLHTKFLLDPEKLHTWSNDGLRCPNEWPDVFTIRAEFEHFHYRVTICCQFRDSLMPALGWRVPASACLMASWNTSGHCICQSWASWTAWVWCMW